MKLRASTSNMSNNIQKRKLRMRVELSSVQFLVEHNNTQQQQQQQNNNRKKPKRKKEKNFERHTKH